MNENEKMIMQLSQAVARIEAILTGDLTTMKEDIKDIQLEMRQQSEKTSEITALKDRISKLESTNMWFARTVMGVVITAVLGLTMIIK